MVDAIQELKTRARLLQREAERGNEAVLTRIRTHATVEDGGAVQRKHCLSTLAKEHGFSGWQHATRVLGGDPDEPDFGKLLIPHRCGGFTNNWFVEHQQARECRDSTNGYLLAYRRQFFVVTAQYVRTLGLDPADPDWTAIGYDWVRPADPDARKRLYAKLLTAS